MKDHYVQLMSNVDTVEFPSNQANHFKNRLPNPLRLEESGWKVGVTGISYPTPPARPPQTHTFDKNDLICRFKWSMQSLDYEGDIVFHVWTLILTGQDLIDDKHLITGGKSLMKYIVNRYETKVRQLVSDKGDTLLTSDSKKYYPVFKWEGDELLLDNSNTFLKQEEQSVYKERKRPQVIFGPKLVETMKWLVKDLYDVYTTSGNLRNEADRVPDDVKKDWTYVDEGRSWSQLWNYSNQGLQLSPYCNWRFVYLDESYRNAFGGSVSVPHRTPMYLYCNAGRSMVMGNQVTDLLREIPHESSKGSYEPIHILYLPVRSEAIDIIELQLAENNGKLVEFSSGVTSVTLHFKHE